MRIGRAVWRAGLLTLALTMLAAAWTLRSLAPDLLREALVRELARRLPVEMSLSGLELAALPPRLAAYDVVVADKGERLITIERVEFRLAILRSLWHGAWIGDLSLDRPSLTASSTSASWPRLVSALSAADESGDGGSSFRPRRLDVRGGSIDFLWSGGATSVHVRNLAAEGRWSGLVHRHVDFDVTSEILVERGAHRLEERRVAARGRISDGRVFSVSAGVIDGQSGSLRWSANVDSRGLRGKLDGTLVLTPVFALFPEAGVVEGGGRVRATLGGTIERPEVGAELEADQVRIDDVSFSGRGRLNSRGDDWKLTDARVQIFGGEAMGTAWGKVTTQVPFELEGRFERWKPETFIRTFGVRVPIVGAWSGDARLAGVLIGDDLRGGGRFTLEERAEKLSGTASFAVSKDSALVEGAVGNGPADEIRVNYRMTEHTKIAGQVEAKSGRLALFGPFVQLRLEGSGTARAGFRGTVDQPVFAGDADVTDLSVEGIRFGAVRGPFEISRQGLTSAMVDISHGEIEARGRIALTGTQENDWSAAIHQAPLAHAGDAARTLWPSLPEVGGKITGSVQVAGPWQRVRLAGRGEIGGGSLAGEALGDGTAEVSLADGQWKIASSLVRSNGARSAAEIVQTADGRVSGTALASGWQLEEIASVHSRWPWLRGVAELSAALEGTLSRPLGNALLRLPELWTGRKALGPAELRLQADGKQVALDGRVGKALTLTAKVGSQAPYPFRARAEWLDLDLAPAIVDIPNVEMPTTGDADLSGDLYHPLGEGVVRISSLRLGRGAEQLEASGPIVVNIVRGALEVGAAAFEGGGQRLTGSGRWAPDEAAVRVQGNGDLALLETLSSEVVSSRGRLQANLQGSRRGAAPWTFRGHAELSDGAVDLGTLVSVTEINGKFALDDRQIRVEALKGRLGGGEFQLSGTLGLDRGWDLGWAVRDANLGEPSWLDYRASGKGRFEGELSAPKLGGEIDFTHAVYDRRIDWIDFLPWFRKQARPARPRPLPFAIDLRVFADDGLFIDNNLAKAEMRADLRVRGEGSSLSWSGSVEMLSGEFVFRRRRFTITSGNVRFHDDRPTNPDLQFNGETSVATKDTEYEIQVRVSGTADNPRIQFSADDPTLSENDVLALVTLGRTLEQLQAQSAGIDLGDVLALTAGSEGDKLQRQVRTFLPVDRIEIEPSFSRVSGVSEPRLSVAKDLTERLSAVVGTGLGGERRQDVGLEYQVTRRFSLQGVWESQTKSEGGAFGTNLKFRVPFRSLPRFSLLPRPATPPQGEP